MIASYERKNKIKNIIFKSMYPLVAGLIIVLILELFSFSRIFDDPDKEYQEKINQNYFIYTPVIPDDIDFCGEKVPVDNFDVRESLDLEILKCMFWHSEAFLYIKRAYRYFPVIEPILKENNIPDDFKYLAVAESGLKNVISPAKAEGYWQFLKATGKEYGLIINEEVDERYDIEKSTRAACKYLQDSYDKYKNWTLVAASYNMGQGALDDVIAEQDEKSYYDLLFNTETARYVYRILAYKLILKNPGDYGFIYREKDLYPEIATKVIKVDTTITSLVDFAKTYNTNYKVLKILNQWLISNKLTNTSGTTYYIKVPKEDARNYDYFKDIEAKDSVIIDSSKSVGQ